MSQTFTGVVQFATTYRQSRRMVSLGGGGVAAGSVANNFWWIKTTKNMNNTD
ncbi:MAG: hypothetical protein GY805_26960 [Chloroflexi bacterium]|nr:hypothetical protein [Chloroflexota bacterium]